MGAAESSELDDSRGSGTDRPLASPYEMQHVEDERIDADARSDHAMLPLRRRVSRPQRCRTPLALCAVVAIIVGTAAWGWSTTLALERGEMTNTVLGRIAASSNATAAAVEELTAAATTAIVAAALPRADAPSSAASTAGAVTPAAGDATNHSAQLAGSSAHGAASDSASAGNSSSANATEPLDGADADGPHTPPPCVAADELLVLDRGGANGSRADGAGPAPWSLLVNYTADLLYAAIPVSSLEAPFTILGTAGRVSGLESAYLHYGVGDGDNYFVLRPHPHKPALDIVRPQLAIRAGSAAYAEAQREGNANVGWEAALRASVCTSADNGSKIELWPPSEAAAAAANASDPRVNSSALRNGSAPVVVVDLFSWVMGGASVVDMKEECAPQRLRLVRARAFERNLLFVVVCGELAEPDKSDDLRTEYSAEDDRTAAIELHISLAFLPQGEEVMEPRRADDRVGYFGQTFTQIGPLPRNLSAAAAAAAAERGAPSAAAAGSAAAADDVLWSSGVSPGGEPSRVVEADADHRVNIINRWRLAKKHPERARSPPVRAITFHIDPTVPRPLWAPVRAGALSWNRAFDKLGYEGAVLVLTPDDPAWPADYDSGDIRFSSITWLPYPKLGLAIGPSHVDPRSGEILYANIVFGEGWVRALRGSWLDQATLGLAHGEHAEHAAHAHAHEQRGARRRGRPPACERSADAPLALLHAQLLARGSLQPGAPVPSEFIAQGLTDVVAHEVGHTLGLRHNFKASALYGPDEIHARSKQTGLVASSVMDYVPPVVAEDAAAQGAYFMERIGPYDEFAIRYGYAELPAGTHDERHAALLAIAAEVAARPRELDRADDGDASASHDPMAMRYDLTADPVRWCAGQAKMAQRLVRAAVEWAEPHDTVWLRQYERVHATATSALGRLWGTCAPVYAQHARGLRYNRTDRAALSAPIAPRARARALDGACALLTDRELALPPAELLPRAATFNDPVYKWGLLTPYAEWVQAALRRRAKLIGLLTDVEQLAWTDLLGWLDTEAATRAPGWARADHDDDEAEEAAAADALAPTPAAPGAEFAAVGGGGAGAATGPSGGAVVPLLEQQLLPWYALDVREEHRGALSVQSSAHLLARVSACVLRPLLEPPRRAAAAPPAPRAAAHLEELERATQGAWVEALVRLHRVTANGTVARAQTAGDAPPFNMYAVHGATTALLEQLSVALARGFGPVRDVAALGAAVGLGDGDGESWLPPLVPPLTSRADATARMFANTLMRKIRRAIADND